MSAIDELRDRLVVVEDKVKELADDSAVTRALAAMSDRDVAVFGLVMRGHTRVLNTIRETQVEHGQTLAEHSRTLAEHGQTLAEHSRTLAEHGQTLAEQSRTLQTLAHGQVAIMQHLGIADHDDGEQGHG